MYDGPSHFNQSELIDREARRAGARRAVHTRRERRDQRAALGIIEFGFNS